MNVELYNEILKQNANLILQINAKSIVAGLSHNWVLTNQTKFPLYSGPRLDQMDKHGMLKHDVAIDYGSYDSHVLDRDALGYLLQWNVFTTSIGNKSVMLSALVEKQNIASVKSLMLQLSQQLFGESCHDDWHVRFLETDLHEYAVLNVFMTNNELPQLVMLGYDIANILRQEAFDEQEAADKYNTIFKPLLSIKYFWNISQPSKQYQANIIDLDNQSNWQEVIDHNFATCLAKLLKTAYSPKELFDSIENTMHYVDDNGYFRLVFPKKNILVLDLNWFISQLPNFESADLRYKSHQAHSNHMQKQLAAIQAAK